NLMTQQSTETKRLLSHIIAEWACSLKYEHLSAEAIQAAKLFWFDSIGCALGGSQQDDAKILLKHYRAMSSAKAASRDSSTSLGMTNKHDRAIGGGNGKATVFVSGFKTNPVDAAFLNGHMIRAMDYNDIYWKADPCHPSDLIAAPLAPCESAERSGKDLILATVIAYQLEMRLSEIARPGVREYGWHHATLSAFAAPIAAARVLNHNPDEMLSPTGISANDVNEIKVEVIARAADILGDPHKYRPTSKETADHSLPYCMAVGLVDGMVTPLQFREERVRDQSLIPIMDKVKVVANEEF